MTGSRYSVKGVTVLLMPRSVELSNLKGPFSIVPLCDLIILDIRKGPGLTFSNQGCHIWDCGAGRCSVPELSLLPLARGDRRPPAWLARPPALPLAQWP